MTMILSWFKLHLEFHFNSNCGSCLWSEIKDIQMANEHDVTRLTVLLNCRFLGDQSFSLNLQQVRSSQHRFTFFWFTCVLGVFHLVAGVERQEEGTHTVSLDLEALQFINIGEGMCLAPLVQRKSLKYIKVSVLGTHMGSNCKWTTRSAVAWIAFICWSEDQNTPRAKLP